jgi:hypothetical protein
MQLSRWAGLKRSWGYRIVMVRVVACAVVVESRSGSADRVVCAVIFFQLADYIYIYMRLRDYFLRLSSRCGSQTAT